jgi:polysaccharide pyruvyl transferase CsaB
VGQLTHPRLGRQADPKMEPRPHDRRPATGEDFAITTIGITGSYGGLNVGDEAILTAILCSLRTRLPDAAITVFSRDAEQTRTHHAVESAVEARALTRDEARGHMEGLDLLLLGGGGLLYDGEARHYLRDVRVAQKLGVPTMAYAIGAGPLAEAEERMLIAAALSGMQAVTVRDVGAKRMLEQADVAVPIEVTADPALLLTPESFPRHRLVAEGVPAGRQLVGMSLREPGGAAPELDVEGYHAALAHCADFVVGRFDCDVVYVPMERSDVRLSHAVIARMVHADRAHVLNGTYSPAELLGLMEHLEMVIAMRLHALIFAALAGTPLFALPYAPKITDFVAAVGGPEPQPVSEDSVGSLLAAVDRSWDLRADSVRGIGPEIDRLRGEAGRTLDIALACLSEGAGRRRERGVLSAVTAS